MASPSQLNKLELQMASELPDRLVEFWVVLRCKLYFRSIVMEDGELKPVRWYEKISPPAATFAILLFSGIFSGSIGALFVRME